MFIMIPLIGCQQISIKTSTFSHEPKKISVYDKEAIYQRTLVVYHNNGVVSKLKIVDESVFNRDDVELIKDYDNVNKITFEGEVFKVDGFSQTSEIQENIYISTIVLQYDKMDMQVLIEQDNWFINAKNIVNDDFEVAYVKLEKLILEDGYELLE